MPPVVFLKAPLVIDPFLTRTFDFRILAQNRRVVDDETRREELDLFHQVLTSISEGFSSELVRRFLVDCYVRGGRLAAETIAFEGSTAVFTKRSEIKVRELLLGALPSTRNILRCKLVRRYRDRWNRTITRRVAHRHNHSLKVRES